MPIQETSGSGRRKSSMERIVFATAVQYEPEDESKRSDLTCDLSQGGLYLSSRYPFDTDEKLLLSFAIPKPGQDLAISCHARVAWTNTDTDRRKIEYPPGAGLQFLDLSGTDRTALARFINAYDTNKKMDVVCAWCGAHLGLRKGPLGKTSHGICVQCREKMT